MESGQGWIYLHGSVSLFASRTQRKSRRTLEIVCACRKTTLPCCEPAGRVTRIAPVVLSYVVVKDGSSVFSAKLSTVAVRQGMS